MSRSYVWRLTPTSLFPELWKFSKFRGSVIVRASSESRARGLVAEEIGIPVVISEGRVEVGDPWASPLAVTCARIEPHSRWSVEGKDQVLWLEGGGWQQGDELPP